MSQIVLFHTDKNYTIHIKKSFLNQKVANTTMKKESFQYFDNLKKVYSFLKVRYDTPFVFCDIDANFEESVKLLQAMSKNTHFAKMRVIFIGQSDNDISEVLKKNRNYFGFMRKPFISSDVMKRINSMLHDEKEKLQQKKKVKLKNQQGAKIVLHVSHKYIMQELKAKPNAVLLKKMC